MNENNTAKEPVAKFTPEYHADITLNANKGTLNSVNLGLVIAANLGQDLHQVDSERHFDNCCFEEGVEYIKEEWKTVEQETDFGSVLAAFGRLLHTVQDFYSHSNWVEIHLSFDPIPVWDLEVNNLPSDIVSGTWIIGIPKKCSEGAPTHSELNKDELGSKEGGKTASTGPHAGEKLFSIAREVALRATLEQFGRLKELRKQDLSFDIDAQVLK